MSEPDGKSTVQEINEYITMRWPSGSPPAWLLVLLQRAVNREKQ